MWESLLFWLYLRCNSCNSKIRVAWPQFIRSTCTKGLVPYPSFQHNLTPSPPKTKGTTYSNLNKPSLQKNTKTHPSRNNLRKKISKQQTKNNTKKHKNTKTNSSHSPNKTCVLFPLKTLRCFMVFSGVKIIRHLFSHLFAQNLRSG